MARAIDLGPVVEKVGSIQRRADPRRTFASVAKTSKPKIEDAAHLLVRQLSEHRWVACLCHGCIELKVHEFLNIDDAINLVAILCAITNVRGANDKHVLGRDPAERPVGVV